MPPLFVNEESINPIDFDKYVTLENVTVSAKLPAKINWLLVAGLLGAALLLLSNKKK